jgi:hypothetical protein
METTTYPYFKDITDKKNYDLFVSRIKRSFDKDNLNPEIYQIKKQIQEKYKEPKKDEVSAEKMEELSKKITEIKEQISFPKYIKVITKEDAQKNIEEYNKFSNAGGFLIKLQELELEKKLLPYKNDPKLLSIKKERYLNLLTLQKLIMNQRKWAWDFMVTGINKPNFLQEIKDKRAELVIYNKEDTAKWNEIKKDTLRIANQVPNDIADTVAEIIYDIVYVGIRSNAKRIGPKDIFESSFPIEMTHMYPLFSKLPSFTKEIKIDETEIEKNNLFTHSIQYILHNIKGKGVRFSNKFYTFLNNLIIDFLSYVSDFSKIVLHRYIGNNIGLTVSREIVRNAILLLLGPKNKYILDTVLSPLVKKERKKEIKKEKEIKEKEVKEIKEKEIKEKEIKEAKEIKAKEIKEKEAKEAKEVTKVVKGLKKEIKDIRTGTIIRS